MNIVSSAFARFGVLCHGLIFTVLILSVFQINNSYALSAMQQCIQNAHGQSYIEQLMSGTDCMAQIDQTLAQNLVACVKDQGGGDLYKTMQKIEVCMFNLNDERVNAALECVHIPQDSNMAHRIDNIKVCLLKR